MCPNFILKWLENLENSCTSQWRHNEHDGVSNHQPHDCLLNSLFRCRSKKISKLRVTGLCEGNSSMTGEFSAQRASDAENVSILWRHHNINQMDVSYCKNLSSFSVYSWARCQPMIEAVTCVTLAETLLMLLSRMMTLCYENASHVTGGLPSQKANNASFDVFFDIRFIRQLSKQSRCRWYKTHYDVTVMVRGIEFLDETKSCERYNQKYCPINTYFDTL